MTDEEAEARQTTTERAEATLAYRLMEHLPLWANIRH
jgi:hypothetical protein